MAMTFKTNLLPDQDLVRELGSSTQKWKINGVTDPKLTDTVTTVTTSGSGNAITAISASNGAITATKGTTFLTSHQDISGKVNKSGDTMTGQLKTSFESGVVMGSFGATSTTIPDLVEELRFSSGCNGSVNITTAYTSPTTNENLPTGWYNFFYAPHRSGGVNGAKSGDNCDYGTIILTGMTIDSQCWRIRIASSGTIAEVRRILNSGDGSYVKKSGDTMTGILSAPMVYGTQTAEGQVGVSYNGGKLYLWGNNISGSAGLYDSNGRYILQRDSGTNKYRIYGDQLIIDNGTNPDGNTQGHGVKIWHDVEGGNIGIYAGKSNQTDNYYYEIDAYNGYLRCTAAKNGAYLSTPCWISPTKGLFGAVWNDYAEFRKDNEKEKDVQQPGRCIKENGDGTLSLTTRRLERGCEIISDTFGFSIGYDEENGYNTPIASNGRVLAYPYESIEEFTNHIGWPVCSGPNGTVSIMTEEEEEKYPSRIIGTISEIPSYEEWGTGKVKVNGRIWIRIK